MTSHIVNSRKRARESTQEENLSPFFLTLSQKWRPITSSVFYLLEADNWLITKSSAQSEKLTQGDKCHESGIIDDILEDAPTPTMETHFHSQNPWLMMYICVYMYYFSNWQLRKCILKSLVMRYHFVPNRMANPQKSKCNPSRNFNFYA